MHCVSLYRIRLIVLSAVMLPAVWLTPARCQAQGTPAAERPKPHVGHPDESESFDMVMGIAGGGGFDSSSARRAVEYAGIKIGGGCCVRGKHPFEHGLTLTLDIGYDRLRSSSGASTGFTVMVGMLRFPNRGTTSRSTTFASTRNRARDFASEELGYYSLKGMIALMSEKQIMTFRVCPIVELQRRFSFAGKDHGDTRLTIGLMCPLCKHCGFD